MNVYFANGKERHKTIDSYDVQKLAHNGKGYLSTHSALYIKTSGVFLIDIIQSVINVPPLNNHLLTSYVHSEGGNDYYLHYHLM